MSETSEVQDGTPANNVPPVIMKYKRTISDLLPDKYEFAPDTHLYLAPSLPPDNNLGSTYAQDVPEGAAPPFCFIEIARRIISFVSSI